MKSVENSTLIMFVLSFTDTELNEYIYWLVLDVFLYNTSSQMSWFKSIPIIYCAHPGHARGLIRLTGRAYLGSFHCFHQTGARAGAGIIAKASVLTCLVRGAKGVCRS